MPIDVLVTATINDIRRQTTKGTQRRWFAVVGNCCHGDGEWSFGVRWGRRGERTKLQLRDGSSPFPSSVRIRFGPSLLHRRADDATLPSVPRIRVPVSSSFVVVAPLAPCFIHLALLRRWAGGACALGFVGQDDGRRDRLKRDENFHVFKFYQIKARAALVRSTNVSLVEFLPTERVAPALRGQTV